MYKGKLGGYFNSRSPSISHFIIETRCLVASSRRRGQKVTKNMRTKNGKEYEKTKSDKEYEKKAKKRKRNGKKDH